MVPPIPKILLSNNKFLKSTLNILRYINSSAEHFRSKPNKIICDSPTKTGPEELTLRCKLATLYRLVELRNWDSDVLNHITVRLPLHDDVILINAFGLLYDEVTSSNLLKVKLNGSIVEQGTSNFGVNLAGMVLHSALHEARPDVNCILHFHQRHVQAISSLECGLLRTCLESCILGNVSRHPFQGITIFENEKEELGKNLGPVNKIMLLDNHGAVICAHTVEEAWQLAIMLVHSCQTQISALQAAGGDVSKIKLIDDETSQKTFDTAWSCNEGNDLTTSNNNLQLKFGEHVFEADVRKLERMGFHTGLLAE